MDVFTPYARESHWLYRRDHRDEQRIRLRTELIQPRALHRLRYEDAISRRLAR